MPRSRVTGKMRELQADRDELEHGMLFKFSHSANDLSEHDMLFITTPNGQVMTLVPVEMVDDGILVVTAQVGPSMSLNFKLVPVDEFTRKLEMEPQHIELKRMGAW
ncbi:MAG: hypothetical protein MnENMB40S_28930 [Rhizobiaceae bacterium MnEN-MB40S]|nr:MAG: hypothetical protein MnENMB40S_28930 [Rhizobiaceae bacterium MnEN-MB40S]